MAVCLKIDGVKEPTFETQNHLNRPLVREKSNIGDLLEAQFNQRRAALETYKQESKSLDKLGVIKVLPQVVRGKNVRENPLVTLAKTVIYRRYSRDLENELLQIPAVKEIPAAVFGVISPYCNMSPKSLNKALQDELLAKCL